MTNFELGTRVPLIISAPWIKSTKGLRSMALAEAVDLYPTLSELAMGAGQLPTGKAGEYLGGSSLAPIFHDISAKVKDVSLSQFARCWQNSSAGCSPDPEDNNGGCGYSNQSSSLAGGHIGPPQPCCPGDERNMTVSMNQMSDCHWMHRSAIDFMGYTMRTGKMLETHHVHAHLHAWPDHATVVHATQPHLGTLSGSSGTVRLFGRCGLSALGWSYTIIRKITALLLTWTSGKVLG